MSQAGQYVANSSIVVDHLTGNSGGQVGPDGTGNINIIGSGAINVVGTPVSHTLTISTTPMGLVWNPADTTTPLGPMSVNNGYVANGSAATVEYTLPVTAAYGTMIAVVNVAFSFGWKIKQNSGQQIIVGDVATTVGASGFVESVGLGDSVILLCVVANTLWIAISVSGNPQGT